MSKEDERQALIFGDGPLTKANLVILDQKQKENFSIPVEFNPTSYTISRNMEYQPTNGIGQEIHPTDMQPIKGKLAEMKLTMYLDSSSELKEFAMSKKMEEYIFGDDELADVCLKISKLTKYDHESHMPDGVLFSWGSLQFLGFVKDLNITYEMFNREGKPVKAKIDMTLIGEERAILNEIKANPNESPDRTKYRSLGQVDELWMLAYDEYDDSSAWKDIAKENGILNPRKVDYTKLLKVPSV